MSQTSRPQLTSRPAARRFHIGDEVNFRPHRNLDGAYPYIVEATFEIQVRPNSWQDLYSDNLVPHLRLKGPDRVSIDLRDDCVDLYLVTPVNVRVTRAIAALLETSKELGQRIESAIAKHEAAQKRREYGLHYHAPTRAKPASSAVLPPARRASKFFDNAF